MSKDELRELKYTYMCLLGDYKYKTTMKGKTIISEGSGAGGFKFKVSLIDTGTPNENIDKLNTKINKVLKKFKKNGSSNELLKYDIIKKAYEKCTNKNKFINNFNRLNTTHICFKKRKGNSITPDENEINYYFVNGVYLKKHEKHISEFLENLEDDKVRILFEGSTLLCNDKYFISTNNSRSDVEQIELFKQLIEENEYDNYNKLNCLWKSYVKRLFTKSKLKEFLKNII